MIFSDGATRVPIAEIQGGRFSLVTSSHLITSRGEDYDVVSNYGSFSKKLSMLASRDSVEFSDESASGGARD